MAAIDAKYAVQMKGITKHFGGFTALNKVDLNVKKGTIHALLGENGAGKSTLMNILYGIYGQDEGEIYLNGKKVDIKNPSIAIENGIGMVHQHFMLIENFTVAQNIILGKEITKSLGILDYKKAKKEILELGDRYGLKVDPDARIDEVSVAMQQRVEILKALYRGADILILDEPTAVLTPQEIDDLIAIMKQLTKDGKTIIIITHKLAEIKNSSDDCTIIRHGKYIDTVLVCDVGEKQLATMMVGREVSLEVDKGKANPKEVIFEIKDLHVNDARNIERVKGLSLNVRKGEILGIAGIDGNGQSELVAAITGLQEAKSGEILMEGKNIVKSNPYDVRANNISTIHEDRHRRGLVMDFTVAENLVLENYIEDPFSKNKRILQWTEIQDHATELIKEFDIRPADSEQRKARSLSGGNQQKVIIARELTSNPNLLIAVQPTRGLDVGAIEFVHKSLIEQRDKGKAILLISFELDEIFQLSDRINVIYDGKIVGELDPDKTSNNEVGLLMAGGGMEK